ncbi:N5-carboxyaminoimidazole ribonucleotide synthase [Halobacillus andaensis]|uniref:N5-carboxyaminoimidazole ribonucleotide synthase n=1 Tax=Halobacillus andaensis TaxID=1176239 RepID=A0A917B810_HALAA|nr:5-(carboxyamino)imidazole ribonucleotide synthase [Halobacillus andaensis]MBP2005735.1 5-(carboxyamino)imidazole ribonucleotide synthase [Halobacillus andaensis]GGF26431.1 N5-carboxyaminoimidazole ribonucleotide synthase [Halobacillus andaensis]
MTNKVIRPGDTIGILGGGQLGRMMAVAAKHMGYRIAVLDPTEDCPCAQVADLHIQANYNDLEAAEKLSEASDVITYEFENVDLEVAKRFEEAGKLPQGAYSLEVTQNRSKEKSVAVEADLPVADYAIVQTVDQLHEALETIDFPAVVKTISGGYDGKGQLKFEYEEDLPKAKSFMKDGGQYIVEKWLAFDHEISQVFTRGIDGNMTFFPIGENVHRHQILHETRVPATVSSQVETKVQEAVTRLAEKMNIVGTFAVEMFVKDENIYINEMAPRPHNSGHYTIEACSVSQFEQHVRAICGLPLLPVYSFASAVMVNVLGKHRDILLSKLEEYQGIHLHDYGKKDSRMNRKMGHLTIIGDNLEEIDEIIANNNIHMW